MGREGYTELLKVNNIQFSENEAMASHTSFKIGGGADLFVCPDSVDKLRLALTHAKEKGLPYFILGNGSNLLVSDKGIEGVVLSTSCLKRLALTDEETVFAEAGATLASLCVFAKEQGLTGLEFAYGIPGSVGGALYMNAGAYGGDMAGVVASAESLSSEDFSPVTRDISEMNLGYRKSIYEENGEIITGVYFKLKKGDKTEIADAMNTFILRRKASQPLDYPSAGSTFKRPVGYFAAALIEECGLKGRAVGGAKVSEKHAGFVINAGGATCSDVLGLIEVIKDAVKEQKGVDLSTEVIFTGRE